MSMWIPTRYIDLTPVDVSYVLDEYKYSCIDGDFSGCFEEWLLSPYALDWGWSEITVDDYIEDDKSIPQSYCLSVADLIYALVKIVGIADYYTRVIIDKCGMFPGMTYGEFCNAINAHGMSSSAPEVIA